MKKYLTITILLSIGVMCTLGVSYALTLLSPTPNATQLCTEIRDDDETYLCGQFTHPLDVFEAFYPPGQTSRSDIVSSLDAYLVNTTETATGTITDFYLVEENVLGGTYIILSYDEDGELLHIRYDD